ncbi:CGNR zinc finger domain-containing protein [Chelatococcus asaccharovorans]|uniref:CGNR zinc finger domain-containing protein n=1 Tax=Chelatococcus asaccharovorans TaxID=28210 RepID=UPI00224C7486|nr:CGNR zinc finger domain-containing protein [Chelatococcus asaccharovorans]CAH1664593.1 conserved hypothetical protein [Chelatococcus asaccharovorans]CAH1682311.1 conserved hypothetical protein [Chelatococcus asaccharovorans]
MTIEPQEFRFNSGRLSLDLPATIRRRASTPQDVLATSGAPARWLRDAFLTQGLLVLSSPEERELLALRDTIWNLADAAAGQRPLPEEAVAHLNKVASHALAVPQLDAASGRTRLIADDPFRTALATVARDAVELLGGPQKAKIKACAQTDCRMLFVDASRSSRRRWCSMDRCGSRAKGETFRQRHAGGAHEHSGA